MSCLLDKELIQIVIVLLDKLDSLDPGHYRHIYVDQNQCHRVEGFRLRSPDFVKNLVHEFNTFLSILKVSDFVLDVQLFDFELNRLLTHKLVVNDDYRALIARKGRAPVCV